MYFEQFEDIFPANKLQINAHDILVIFFILKRHVSRTSVEGRVGRLTRKVFWLKWCPSVASANDKRVTLILFMTFCAVKMLLIRRQ